MGRGDGGGGGRRWGAICLALALGACPRDPPEEGSPGAAPASAPGAGRRAPAGALRGPASAAYTVYFTRAPDVPPGPLVARLLQGTPWTVVPAGARPPPGPSVRAFATDVAASPPPDAQALLRVGRGLRAEERLQVAAASEAYSVEFSYPAEGAAASLRAAEALAAELAVRTGGYLHDQLTDELFTPPAWARLRGEAWRAGRPVLADHTALRIDRHGPGYRVVSAGMAKLGLPDLALEVSSDWLEQGQALLQLALAAEAQRPVLDEAGTLETGRPRPASRLPLLAGEPHPGDPPGRVLELAVGPELLGAMGELPAPRPGFRDDPELAAACARARARLAARREALAADLAAGRLLQVKAWFRGSGYRWVDVQQWRGRVLVGSLVGAARYGDQLGAGSRITLDEAEIVDWVISSPDGGTEGNETAPVLMARPP